MGEKQSNHWNKLIILTHFDILYNVPLRWKRRIYVAAQWNWFDKMLNEYLLGFKSVYVTMLLGLFTLAFVSQKFSVCLPCFYIRGAPKHFLQHSILLLGGASIFCIFSRISFGSFLSASLYSLSKTSMSMFSLPRDTRDRKRTSL